MVSAKPITRTDIAAIKANLISYSHEAISDWASFPWHRRDGEIQAHKTHSSQALAIDVFGTIAKSPDCDAILYALAKEVLYTSGIETDLGDQGWREVCFEWQDPRNALRERPRTQVDVYVEGANILLLVECKFTEEGGRCSQTAKRDGVVQCNGAYRMQTNPKNRTQSRCALTGKEIRYWKHIPYIYGLDPDADHDPCPFASDAYQWMRNTVLARALTETTGKIAFVVAAYADAPHLQTAAKVKQGILGLSTLSAEHAIVPMSYDAIIRLAAETARSDLARWDALREWVQAKVDRARRIALPSP